MRIWRAIACPTIAHSSGTLQFDELIAAVVCRPGLCGDRRFRIDLESRSEQARCGEREFAGSPSAAALAVDSIDVAAPGRQRRSTSRMRPVRDARLVPCAVGAARCSLGIGCGSDSMTSARRLASGPLPTVPRPAGPVPEAFLARNPQALAYFHQLVIQPLTHVAEQDDTCADRAPASIAFRMWSQRRPSSSSSLPTTCI